MAPKTPWMDLANSYLGLAEKPGTINDERIVAFFSEVGQGWIKDDETAWCAAFAGALLKRCGYIIPRGVEAVRARAYGAPVAVKVDTPRYGDLVLLNYGQAGVIDHVSFYVEDASPTTVRCLGGNQSNQVKVSTFKKADVAGYYRPVLAMPVAPAQVPQPPDVEPVAQNAPNTEPPAVTGTDVLGGAIAAGSIGVGAWLWNALGWVGLVVIACGIAAGVITYATRKKRG